MILVGPGKHFGVEIIDRFLREGFIVGVISSQRQTLDQLEKACGDTGGRVKYYIGDVSNPDQFYDLAKNVSKNMGRIDCVIYNPKVSYSGSGLRLSLKNLNASMAVNVTGALTTIQSFFPQMARSGRGSIIVTGGGYKDRPDVEKFALSVGKAALHGLVKALIEPLAREGISLKTVVIDGAIRRADVGTRSSSLLADFYWSVFNESRRSVYRFPPSVDSDGGQLELPI